MLTDCRVAAEIGVDPEIVLQTCHGRRTIDTLKALCPEKANLECESLHCLVPDSSANITRRPLTSI